MKPGILYTHGEYRAELKLELEDDIFELINNSVWGTKENRYSHLDTANHIPYLNDPHYFCLYRKEELCALVVFNSRKVFLLEKETQAYYVRYFLANEKFKGRGIVPRHAERVMNHIKSHTEGGLILYAAVEKKNRNSFRIVEKQGFHQHGTLQTRGFSRFFPRLKVQPEELSVQEKPKLIQLLEQKYQSYVMRHFMTHFQGEPYYVVKKEGEIVAGVQLQRSHWRIESMSGGLGWLVMNVLPFVPLVRNIFHPKKFKFLSFEGFYYKEGQEQTLFDLMESLLAQEKYHSALIFLDSKSDLAKYIQKRPALMGLLYHFTKNTDSHIMVHAQGLQEEDKEKLKTQPFYTCSYDYI